MTVKLHEAGHFTWPEWAQYLGAAVAAGKEDEDAGRKGYYDHWLVALERIIADKGLSDANELDERKLAWKKAYERTPHGEAVDLSRGMN